MITLPMFLFWRWLFRKLIKKDRLRIIITWAATLIVSPAIYGGLILLLIFGMTYTPCKDFDKSQWLAKEKRFQMADDIINTKLLINKDTTQVKQILGEPNSGYGSTWRSDTLNTWVYDMGAGGGGLGFLFHHLLVKFEKGKVVAVEHAEIRD